MNSPAAATASSADVLLQRMERVRVLASQLVRQAADHDDLVQEVVARALASPTELVGDPEPWIRRVLKNLAIDRQRSRARREAREERAMGAGSTVPTAFPSTADSVASAEKQRDLVNAVLRLNEPYRSVILQRFFDGLPPREIAKAAGVPVATVKKQQERGMALLRKELEARYGDKGAWAVALLPLLSKRSVGALKSGGAGWIAAWSLVCAVLTGGLLSGLLGGTWSQGDRAIEPHDSMVIEGESVAMAEAGPTIALVGGAPSAIAPIRMPIGFSADVADELVPLLHTFRGAFVDEVGEPIPLVTAQCRLMKRSGSIEGPRSLGSPLGVVQATIEGPLDLLLKVRVDAEGFAPAEFRFRPDLIDSKDPTALDVGVQTLYRAADLLVRVVDAHGEPQRGWTINYFYYGGGARLEKERRVANAVTGAALFDNIAATEVEVGAEHPSGFSLTHPRRRLSPEGLNSIDLVHVGPDLGRRIGVALQLPRTAWMSKGDAVELQLLCAGQEVRRLQVSLADRKVAFDDVDPGEYELQVMDPRFHEVHLPAKPGASVELELSGNGSIELTVADAAGGPCTGGSISQVSCDRLSIEPLSSFKDGGARLTNIVPGEDFSILVTGEHGRSATVAVKALQPRETRLVVLTLGDGVSGIAATVVRGAAQEPVAGAAVAFVGGNIQAGSKLERDLVARLKSPEGLQPLRLLGRGTTDAAGEIMVQIPNHDLVGPVTMLALSGDFATAPVKGGVAHVVLASVGRVGLVLKGIDGELPPGVALTVGDAVLSSSSRAPFGSGAVLKLGADGLWWADAVPTGEATIRLAFSDFNHVGRGTQVGQSAGPVGYTIGRINVKRSATAELTVDVKEVLPARVTVQALEARLPVRDAYVELEPVGSLSGLPAPTGGRRHVSRRIVKLTDGTGMAVFPVVPRGEWRVRVRDENWRWTQELGIHQIDPGSRFNVIGHLDLVDSFVSIVDARTGAPLQGHEIWFEPRLGARIRHVTDRQGRVTLRLGHGYYRFFPTEAATEPSAVVEWGPGGPVESVLRM